MAIGKNAALTYEGVLCRRHVSKLLILDGREKLEMWWVEEGYLTDLSSVLLVRTPRAQALCCSRLNAGICLSLRAAWSAE